MTAAVLDAPRHLGDSSSTGKDAEYGAGVASRGMWTCDGGPLGTNESFANAALESQRPRDFRPFRANGSTAICTVIELSKAPRCGATRTVQMAIMSQAFWTSASASGPNEARRGNPGRYFRPREWFEGRSVPEYAGYSAA